MVHRSKKMDDDELTLLIDGGESARVEFKEALTGGALEGIREAICAFANDISGSGEPGIVVVGLKDSGEHSGLLITKRLIDQLSHMRSDGNILPPPTLFVERRRYRDAEVAVVTVRPSDSPPVRYKGRIYVHGGPRRGIATAYEERILNERRRAQDRFVDVAPIPGTGPGDLNRRQFEDEYLPNAVSARTLQENKRNFKERLASTKMIASADDERATLLGLLVIGKRPRDFAPGAYVQFLRVAGGDITDEIVDNAVFDGVVSDIIRRMDEKMQSHNRIAIDFTKGDRERRDAAYPLPALQQLTRNALMHRAYEATNAPVRVTWFDDRIEILSPGGPFGNVTEQNFGRPGVTDYRNPNLAEAMRVLDYVQRFGAGVPTARRLLEEAGHPELEFAIDPTHVLAVVRGLSVAGEPSA